MPNIRIKNLYFIVIPILSGLAFVGCKKEKQTTTYDFSYSGSPYVGNAVHFAITPSSGSKFAWDFGDKNTAAMAKPDHIYTVAGSYSVLLVVNDDITHPIRKTVKIGFDSILMSSLTGSKSFHHKSTSHRETSAGGDSVTVTNYPDVTVSVLNIDPVTILFGSDTLNFATTGAGTETFTYSYYNSMGYPTGDYNTLIFYTATNTIHYLHNHMDGVFNYHVEEYYTP